jgi:hypothetical protein
MTFKVCLLGAGVLGCRPSAVEEPPIAPVATCCGGAGTCIVGGVAPAELEAQFDGASCSGALLCAPNDWLFDPYAAPVACRAPGDLEGRCLSTCLTSVAEQADRLDQRGCDRDQRCVPCFDPVTGEDTHACGMDGDAPAEEAHTYQRCCGAAGHEQGMCVPLALLSPDEIDVLSVDSCHEPGMRCAPDTLFAGAGEPRATKPDAGLARCFGAADARGGESCASCARLLRPSPACE